MATITINDLPTERVLDRETMSCVKGAGSGLWVFGWIQPYVPEVRSGGFGSVINLYQTNNIYVAEQMQLNNQFQMIDVSNAAPNTTINLAPAQVAVNQLQQ